MKMKSITLAVMAVSAIAVSSSRAATIFSQDFSANNTVATYVSATPDDGQFNSIGSSGSGVTASIIGGVLTYARTGANAGNFSRTSNFSTIPTAISYQFDLTLTGNSVATTTAAVFQVGSSYTTANSSESNANTYARIGINIGATAGQFGIRDVTNGTSSALFSGTQTFFWVMNNTGALISYTDPTAASSALANDTADLWLGTTKVLNGVGVQTSTQSISDLKFIFDGGSGTIGIDNLVINAIPEPSAALLGAIGAIALLRRRR